MVTIKVSIIIPVYNTECYLQECLESVLNQKYSNMEIICINDGSTDGSLDILKDYQENNENIKVINQKNAGLSAARNAGLKHFTGDFVFFLDSDDFLCNDEVIDTLVNCAINDNADIVIGGYIYYHDDSIKNTVYEINDKIANNVMSGLELLKIGIKKKLINSVVWNKLYKRKIIENEFFINGFLYEDMEYTLRILSKCKRIRAINDKLINYRQRDNSIMSSKATLKNGIHYVEIAKKIIEQMNDEDKIFSTWVAICIYKSIKISFKLKKEQRFLIINDIKSINNLHKLLFQSAYFKHKLFSLFLILYLKLV